MLATLKYVDDDHRMIRRETVSAKEHLLDWQAQNLQETATGYGRKLTTRFMVQLNGRWRRVYCCCVSNAGTLYVGKPGAWECIVEGIEA